MISVWETRWKRKPLYVRSIACNVSLTLALRVLYVEKSKRARCVSRYDNDDSDDGLSIDLARTMIGNAIPKGINAPHNLSMYIASVIYAYICVNVL